MVYVLPGTGYGFALTFEASADYRDSVNEDLFRQLSAVCLNSDEVIAAAVMRNVQFFAVAQKGLTGHFSAAGIVNAIAGIGRNFC